MDRCKLEYMIKRFDFKEKKKIICEMDPYQDYMFGKDISRFLLNPDTRDMEIIRFIGPSCMIYFCACEYGEDSEILQAYKMDMEREIEEIKEKYIAQYRKINELCIANGTYPFFKDPTNIAECERTRLDIVKIIPEEIINKFFGVESLRDYEPPKYNGE